MAFKTSEQNSHKLRNSSSSHGVFIACPTSYAYILQLSVQCIYRTPEYVNDWVPNSFDVSWSSFIFCSPALSGFLMVDFCSILLYFILLCLKSKTYGQNYVIYQQAKPDSDAIKIIIKVKATHHSLSTSSDKSADTSKMHVYVQRLHISLQRSKFSVFLKISLVTLESVPHTLTNPFTIC